MATAHDYPVQQVDQRIGQQLIQQADAARAASGAKQAELRRELDEAMLDAYLTAYKPARIRVRWSVRVADLEGVHAWSLSHGFQTVDAHADEGRLRRNLGEWLLDRLREGVEVPQSGFDIHSAVQL